MGTQLIDPNLHALLVHFPLGLFTLGMLMELFSIFYRGRPAQAAGRWMIALGVLAMVPATLTGFYALSDVVRRSMPPGEAVDQPWSELVRKTQLHEGKTGDADTEGAQWRLIAGHVWRNGPATAIAVVAVVIGIAAAGTSRRWLYAPVMAMLLFSLGVMLWGSWMGGEMVYGWKTAVQLDRRSAVATPATAPSAAREQTEWRSPRSVAYYAQPLQTHVVVAGVAMAFALAALGLALRNTSRPRPLDADEEERLLNEMPTEPGRRPAVSADLAMVRLFKPAAAVVAPVVVAPAARMWLVAALLAAGASALGIWFLASGSGAVTTARPDDRSPALTIWERITTPAEPARRTAAAAANSAADSANGSMVAAASVGNPLGLNRRLAHVMAGAAIILLPLLLAALARWAPDRRLSLLLVAALLILAISVQVWLGILMLLDSPGGSIFAL